MKNIWLRFQCWKLGICWHHGIDAMRGTELGNYCSKCYEASCLKARAYVESIEAKRKAAHS